jgi:hypothetical protein
VPSRAMIERLYGYVILRRGTAPKAPRRRIT